MISTITESVSYKVENEILHYSHTFKNKDVAETTEKYLQSVVNILAYLKVDLSDNKVIISSTNGKAVFDGTISTYKIEPDWEGHHPNGSTEVCRTSSSSYLNRIVKKSFLDKVKKANNLPNEWGKFVAVFKDCQRVFPYDKKLQTIYQSSYISMAGVKLFDF